MKPKFAGSIRNSLPSLIVITAMIQVGAAAIVDDDADGNANVFVSGDRTVRADGPDSSYPTPAVTINPGVTLTGDASESRVIDISAPNYTVTNFGSLIGTNHHGIYSTNAFNLSNTGTIAGGTTSGKRGIFSTLATITNEVSGTITGTDDGIHFTSNGGLINNYGLISGTTGSVSDGIRGRSGLVVNNMTNFTLGIPVSGGSISGIQYGIYADGGITVINQYLASISASREDAIHLTADGGTVTNFGSIAATGSSSSDGIRGRSGLTVHNNTTTGTSNQPIAGGSITGRQNGILADDGLTVNNHHSASITGTSGNGISTRNNANIYNDFGASITGDQNGISGGYNLYLDNEGTITGTNADGVVAGSSGALVDGYARIINSGTILGAQDGIDLNYLTGTSASAPSYIWNDGTITGTSGNGIEGDNLAQTVENFGTINGNANEHAIRLREGNDVINLYQGSVVNGDVCGGYSGDDLLHFGVDPSHPANPTNIIHGSVTEMETITKSGDSVAFIGSVDESYEIEANTIRITGGALYMNAGSMMQVSEVSTSSGLHAINGGNTRIEVDGAEVGGTGVWNADIMIYNGGAISAGAAPIYQTDGHPADAVGLLTIHGSVTHSYDYYGAAASKISASNVSVALDPTYIIENIIPQTPVNNGVNSDMIAHHGLGISPVSIADSQVQPYGSAYNLTGAIVLIAPTNVNLTLTDGTYTIIDSDAPLLGFSNMEGLGIVLSTDDTGPFEATQSNPSEPSYVLEEFSTLSATDPVYSSGSSIAENNIMPPYDARSNLVLTIEHDFAGLPGLDDNQSSLGAALDASVGSPDGLVQDFIASLDYSDLATVQSTLGSLVPVDILGQASALVSGNYRIHRLAQDHLALTRSGGTVIATPAGTDAKGAVIPAQTTAVMGKGNVWGTFSYDWKDSGANNSSFDGEEASFTAGVDYRFSEDWLAGILLDGSQGDYDYTGGSSDLDSLRIAVYGTYGRSTGLYADFLVGYGNHDLDLDRDLGGVLKGTGTRSSTDADSLQAMLTVGYAMEYQNIKHGPFAGIEYQNVDVDGYTQDGAFPVDVDGFDVDSCRLLIGYRAEAAYGKFTPYASVAYAHEFEDGTIRTTGSVPGGAGFSIDEAGLDSAFLISIGTGYSFTPTLSMNIGYHGEISTGDGVDSHGGSIGLNYSF